MQIGMVGLGRMGGGMAQRLLRGGHEIIVTDPDVEKVALLEAEGARGASDIKGMVNELKRPRVIWLMLPTGDVTNQNIKLLNTLLSPEDTVVNGGNTYYKDSKRHAIQASKNGIHFLDAGTSGGIWGVTEGYSIMIGGEAGPYDRLLPAIRTLAPARDRGFGHVGPSGSGHFVKMIHNGIEYGIMQAYAEGFELLQSKKEFGLDLAGISEIWRHGSVVRSWLLDLAAAAFAEDGQLAHLTSYVDDTGEGRWTVNESVEMAVPAPVITAALQQRFRSRQDNPMAGRVIAALRHQFGGHSVRTATPPE